MLMSLPVLSCSSHINADLYMYFRCEKKENVDCSAMRQINHWGFCFVFVENRVLSLHVIPSPFSHDWCSLSLLTSHLRRFYLKFVRNAFSAIFHCILITL